MKRRFRVVVATAAATCALLVSGTAATAAPGQGAIVVPSFCSIVLPGIGTAEGPGRVVVLPGGNQIVHCTTQLLPGATLPTSAVTVRSGGCVTVVAPSGHAVATCRP